MVKKKKKVTHQYKYSFFDIIDGFKCEFLIVLLSQQVTGLMP